MGDNHLGKCKKCTRKDTKENRLKDVKRWNEFDQDRYRTNILRMIGLKYSGMRRRVLGMNSHSNLIGKKLLSKEEFFRWVFKKESKKEFMRLYNNWTSSGYQRKFSPSIDRINNKLGYVIGNMRWITQQENSHKYNH